MRERRAKLLKDRTREAAEAMAESTVSIVNKHGLFKRKEHLKAVRRSLPGKGGHLAGLAICNKLFRCRRRSVTWSNMMDMALFFARS